jgi:serine/threonine protein kinase
VERFEHYQLVVGGDGRIGSRCDGVTFKAFDVDPMPRDIESHQRKYLGDESARLRFLREARPAASVRHRTLPRSSIRPRAGGNYFYATEEGETLENLIKRSVRLVVRVVLEIGEQVAAGLAAVHKQKLVHRDIKPSNIMVSLEEGGAVTAKIIDLGLAKAVNEPGSQTAISIPGGFAGTPGSASPEAVCRRRRGHPFGSLLAWSYALRRWCGHVLFRGSPADWM